MAEVVLFFPKTSATKEWAPWAPLCVMAVAAPLDHKGTSVQIIDARMEKNYLERVLASCADAICLGITAMTGFQIQDGLQIAGQVKRAYPGVTVVWGGYHPSLLAEQTAGHPLVEIVVRGQGEVTFEEVVGRLQKGEGVEDVQGITYKKDGTVVSNPDRPVAQIETFPPMPYHLINVERYLRRDIADRTLNYISSQGCPFRCAFCADSKIYHRRWLAFSPERVVSELEKLVKDYRITGLVFGDTNFFVNEERVQQICQGIIEKGIKIRWAADARADQFVALQPETMRLIREAGCARLLVGAESGSQKILDMITKDTKVEDAVKLAEICRDLGIQARFTTMFGFPGEDSEDIRQTLSLVERIKAISSDHEVFSFFYGPYPGTELYETALRYGLKEPQSLEEWSYYELTEAHTPWVKKQDRQRIKQLTEFNFPYAYPSRALREKIRRGKLKPIYFIFHKVSAFRCRHNQFGFPLDFKAWQFLKKLHHAAEQQQ